MLRMFPHPLSRLALLLVFALGGCFEARTQSRIPAPQTDEPLAHTSGKQTAVFAGGCFWGTQAVFERTGDDLSNGLYVQLPPWGWHLFRVEPNDDVDD